MMLGLYFYFLVSYALFFFVLGYVVTYEYETISTRLGVSLVIAVFWPVAIFYVMHKILLKL